MLFALGNSLVTLTTEDYRSTLLTAIACTLLALGCLAVPLVRGPTAWRVVALILASPALFVFADFAQRAPYAFGGAADPRIQTLVEPDTRPAFALDPSKPFVIELGRGSGRHGLNIIRVDQTGTVEISRITGAGLVEEASLRLSTADIATLVDLVNSNRLTSMARAYSDPRIADGTQWVLWIEQPPAEKSIYFNNSFPSQITSFANGLDTLLQKAGLNSVKWSPASKQHGVDQQTALWARIERAR